MTNTKTKIKVTRVMHIGKLETRVNGETIDIARLGRNETIYVSN